jgi:16S rRNA (guanine527-N7)-methyltransferase
MRPSTEATGSPNRAPACAGRSADAHADVAHDVDAAIAAVGLRPDAPGMPRIRDQLARFVLTLLRENDRLGLTTIRDPREAVQRHVAEPLAGWRAIAATVPDGPIVEVGTGGGAPGVPIAILAPDREVTLVEARERRAAYLRALADDLGLGNVRVVEERGEAFAAAGDEGRERYACAMGRALAKLPVALELLLPLVRVDGVAAVFAGPGAARWMADAAQVAAALGAAAPGAREVSWPGAPLRLTMVTCRKTSPTPARFPRAVRRMRRELPPPS